MTTQLTALFAANTNLRERHKAAVAKRSEFPIHINLPPKRVKNIKNVEPDYISCKNNCLPPSFLATGADDACKKKRDEPNKKRARLRSTAQLI